MLEVRKINPEMTYSLRHSVLRPHQTVEDCKYDTDHQDNAFHVGAFYHGKLISVASFCVEKHPDFPIEMLVTVTFEDLDGRTKLTLEHSGMPAGSAREGATMGWTQSFEKLAESL